MTELRVPICQGRTAAATAIDLDDISRAKMDFDPLGHHVRPYLFRLIVNERPQRAVQVVGDTLELRGEL